jgi:pimeloyl-ACP methyl ester carboxylesterase
MPKPNPNHKVFSIPKSILLTGKFLQFLSPKLAANFVLKLFKTPFKFKRPKREDKMYQEASKEMLLIPELQKSIQVYKYGQGTKKVLLIHGWAGRGTQLYKIGENLAKKGYQVISFDATAHGDSEGKTSAMPEYIKSIFEIDKQYGPFEFAIGHSLGGMALLQAVKDGFTVKKMVTLGSGDSILDICKQFVNRLGLQPKIAYLLKDKMDKVLGMDSELLSANVAAKEVLIPTLVVHDKQDEDVPVSCAHNIRQSLKNGELLITDGLGHRRILIDTKVIDQIIHFLEK